MDTPNTTLLPHVPRETQPMQPDPRDALLVCTTEHSAALQDVQQAIRTVLDARTAPVDYMEDAYAQAMHLIGNARSLLQSPTGQQYPQILAHSLDGFVQRAERWDPELPEELRIAARFQAAHDAIVAHLRLHPELQQERTR
ncbi:MAG: hypothetical protein DI582_09255 [Azospirillum brasilense]|nr:MAG: hypothetical protein DI582_09255 [Azospirillum brasilense]